VPTKRLPAYAEFLKRLRAGLPAGCQLSATMLLDWSGSVDLPAVMAAVDCIVPQFYATIAPAGPSVERLVAGGELAPVIARLGEHRPPYRIGLPTYEQCSLFNADGSLLGRCCPLAVESALAAGAQVRHAVAGDEHIVELVCPEPLTIAGVRLAAGSRLAIGIPTPAGLGRQLQTVQRLAGAHCLGICLFRLPDGAATHTLSLAQVAAAAAARSGRRNSRRWRVPMATAGR